MRKISKLGLFLISISTLITIIKRLTNWKIYSDSYKFLLIGKAVFSNESVFSKYSEIVWPVESYLMPYKWLFGLAVGLSAKLISFFGIADTNFLFETVAHSLVILSFLFGAILITKIVFDVTKNSFYATLTYLLYLGSGTILIWSGFIITETFSIMLLLILLLLIIKKKPLYLQTIFLILCYLARPELLIVGGIFILFLQSSVLKVILLNNRHYITFLSLVTYMLISVMSDLYTQNFWGDFFILTSYPILLILDIFKDNIKNSRLRDELVVALNFSISVASTVYILFNPDISRYSILLLPLLMLVVVLLALKYFPEVPQNVFYILIIFILTQHYYAYGFPKYQTVDYHAEVAQETLNFASEEGYEMLLVPQPEAFLYYNNPNSKLKIVRLTRDNMYNISYNTLMVNDKSLPYKNIEFDSNEKILVKSFNTKAKFWINSTQSNGTVELWTRD